MGELLAPVEMNRQGPPHVWLLCTLFLFLAPSAWPLLPQQDPHPQATCLGGREDEPELPLCQVPQLLRASCQGWAPSTLAVKLDLHLLNFIFIKPPRSL